MNAPRETDEGAMVRALISRRLKSLRGPLDERRIASYTAACSVPVFLQTSSAAKFEPPQRFPPRNSRRVPRKKSSSLPVFSVPSVPSVVNALDLVLAELPR